MDSNQRNYGVAVTDVDRDGAFEIFVAGFTGPNLVLKYDEQTATLENIAQMGTPFEELMDSKGQAIGIVIQWITSRIWSSQNMSCNWQRGEEYKVQTIPAEQK